MKRWIGFLLLLIVVVSVNALAEDTELSEAIDVGFLQGGELERQEEPIDSIAFYNILMQSVALNQEPVAATLQRRETLESGPIARGDAASLIYAVVLENYFGLDTSEGTYQYDCFEYAKTTNSYRDRCGPAQPCMEFKLFNEGKMEIDVWAVGYCALQYDPYSMKTILDLDEAGYLRIQDNLTRKEAWEAAYRLYRAYRPSSLLTLDAIQPLELSEEQSAMVARMPFAAYNALPAWKGTALDNKTFANGAHHTTSMYTREDFEILHDLGFNFTRLFITHQLLFDLNNGVAARSNELSNLDDAIGYAIDNGVHICICLYDFPGFEGASMDDAGFYDSPLLEQVTQAYSILAKRYQNIPSSVLSFNLFNEPWTMTKKKEKAYVSAVHTVSERIWQYGDRLIFVDGLAGSQEPVASLADEPYAQAFHMYAPDQFTYSGWVGGTTWYAGQQWPLPYANGMLNKGKSLTVQGQFPAGTQVELLLVGNSKKGKVELIADGKTVAELPLEADETKEAKTAVLGSLPNDASELKIRWAGSSFVQIQSVAIISPETDEKGTPRYSSPWAEKSVREIVHQKMTVIYCDYGGIEGKQKNSTLVVEEDGTYTNPAQEKLLYNRDYMEEFVTPWAQLKEKYGVGVMVQEWGTLDCIPKDASLAYISDWIDLLAQYNIPWNLWGDSWQYIDTNRLDVDYEEYRGHRLDRDMVNVLMGK